MCMDNYGQVYRPVLKSLPMNLFKCSSLNPTFLENFDWIYRVKRHRLYFHPGHYNLVEVVLIAVFKVIVHIGSLKLKLSAVQKVYNESFLYPNLLK